MGFLVVISGTRMKVSEKIHDCRVSVLKLMEMTVLVGYGNEGSE